MRIYHLETIGSIDGLVVREEAAPVPSDGEVLVRVRASALNFRDLAIVLGKAPFPVRSGVVPVSDAAGEVEAIGPGVSALKVGDRVVSRFLPTWYGGPRTPNPETYGSDRDGWLTEYKVVRVEALSLAPQNLSFEEAASLPCAAVTAWSALLGVRAGDTVLTQGSGGVSLFALQLAKLLGARVIATTSSTRNGERLKQVGADRVVEVGGPGTLAQSLQAVTFGGEIAIVGALAEGNSGLDFMSLFMSQATLRCISVGSRVDVEAMQRAVNVHAMHPVIDSVFPFADAKAAWAHYAGRDVFGKIVIRH